MNKVISNYLNNCNKMFHELYHDFLATKTEFKGQPHKHLPNILTSLRVIAVPVVIGTVIIGNLPLALGLSIGASVTDFFDGFLARKWHAHSEYGRKLDTMADKGLAGTLGIINTFKFPIFLITIALELCITKINLKAHLENKQVQTIQLGRGKTVLLDITLLLGLASMINPIFITTTMIGIGATTVLQLGTIAQYKKRYSDEEVSSNNDINTETNNDIINDDVKSNEKVLKWKKFKKDIRNFENHINSPYIAEEEKEKKL